MKFEDFDILGSYMEKLVYAADKIFLEMLAGKNFSKRKCRKSC